MCDLIYLAIIQLIIFLFENAKNEIICLDHSNDIYLFSKLNFSKLTTD